MIMINRSTYTKNLILNVHASNNRAFKSVKEEIIALKGETDKFTQKLPTTGRTRQKVRETV